MTYIDMSNKENPTFEARNVAGGEVCREYTTGFVCHKYHLVEEGRGSVLGF
jgi:hypothetical protein